MRNVIFRSAETSGETNSGGRAPGRSCAGATVDAVSIAKIASTKKRVTCRMMTNLFGWGCCKPSGHPAAVITNTDKKANTQLTPDTPFRPVNERSWDVRPKNSPDVERQPGFGAGVKCRWLAES